MPTTPLTYVEFIAAYPAFATVAESSVTSALALSERLLDATAWGNFYSDAIALDAAHNLTMDALVGTTPAGGVKGAAGAISSVSAAGMNTSFAVPDLNTKDKSELWYGKTVYGQKFLRLRQVVIPMGALAC